MIATDILLLIAAVLAGFTITKILEDWGASLLARPSDRDIPLHILASATLLLQALRYIWTLWELREIDWVFWNFVLVLMPIFLIGLAAHVMNASLSEGDRESPSERYFSRAKPFFYLQMGISFFWTLSDLNNLETVTESIGMEMNLTIFSLRFLSLLAYIWVANSRNPIAHWLVLSAVFGSLVFFSLNVAVVLPS